MYCTNCGKEMNDNQAICLNCGVKTGSGNAYCGNCGRTVNPGAEFCMNCGVSLKKKTFSMETELGGYNKWLMALICFVLGSFGVHNFMMCETKKGLVKIVATVCCGIGSILALIDFVKILVDKYEVNEEKYI